MQIINRGVYPVLTTPYLQNGTIDFSTLYKEIDHVFDVGAHGVTFALVSDVMRLTVDERLMMPHQLVEAVNGRGAVIMSVGAESVDQACIFAGGAEDAGVTAVMAIPPTLQIFEFDKLEAYFIQILDNISIPMIIQDASGYLGNPMSLDLQVALHQVSNNRVWFKPEAEPLGQRQSELRDATGGKAVIFEGSGGIAIVDAHHRGAHGTMPGCDLLEAVCALWQALENDDKNRIYELYLPICAIVSLQIQGGLDGFIAIERYLLELQNILPPQTPRTPFAYNLDRETRLEINRLYNMLVKIL